MRLHFAVLLVVSSALVQTSFSQQAVAPSAAVVSAAVTPTASPIAASMADASGKYMLREGVDVSLTFAQDLSSKTSSEGDPIAFTLVDDLKVGDVVVVKAGSKAFG
jgi:hypothetical protein